MMKRTLATLMFFGLACGSSGSSDDPDTTSVGDTGDDENPDTAIDADPDTATDDEEPVSPFVVLSDPCQGAGTPHGLLFQDDQTGFVGCGNGYGLWRTDNAGESFQRGHPSADLYVSAITETPDGRILVCGRDYEGGKGMLFASDGDGWETLLRFGTDPGEPQHAAISNCGAVADLGDGRLIVSSLTVGDLVYSEDGGQTWSPEERYWEDANLTGGYSYYYMLNLRTLSDGTVFGAGSQITEPPVFFGPTLAEDGGWMNFHAYPVSDTIIGEVWAMATPDDGASWFVGGRDQSATRRASGFLFASDDAGDSWSTVALGDDIDIVHDIAFDGRNGVAVGHRYPTSNGGFVLTTIDGGKTWTEFDRPVPLLQSAAVSGDHFWIAGDAYLARGAFIY
ncbi:MAG: hypothetical protein AAFV53_18290 [Myxococcota bacterium]